MFWFLNKKHKAGRSSARHIDRAARQCGGRANKKIITDHFCKLTFLVQLPANPSLLALTINCSLWPAVHYLFAVWREIKGENHDRS